MDNTYDAAAVAGSSAKGLWIQLAGILVAIAALFAWLAPGDLTDAERATLAPDTLRGYTREHLKLTAVVAWAP